MSDQEVPCRDTTYEGVVPEKVWVTFDNRKRPGAGLTVTLEINGIDKEINAFKYFDEEHGHILHSHNLTWILVPLKEKIERQRRMLEKIRSFDRLRGYPTGTEWADFIKEIREVL